MYSLYLLDIESQVRQPVLHEKSPDLVWKVQRVLRKHHNNRRFYSILLQQFNTTHSTIKSPLTRSIHPISVMDRLGTIQTDTHMNIVALEKFAPLLIDQRAIRLKEMHHTQAPRIALLGYTKGVLVKGYG